MLDQDTRVQNDFSTVAKEMLSRNTGTISDFQGSVISHVPVTVQKGQDRYWKLMLSASRSKVLETVNEFWMIFAVFLAGTFLLSIFAAVLLARSIAGPPG